MAACIYLAIASMSFIVRNPLSPRYMFFYKHPIKVLTLQVMPEYQITRENLEDMLRRELKRKEK